jgi:hypothetical protein
LLAPDEYERIAAIQPARSLNEASTISGETHTVAPRRFDRPRNRSDDLLSTPLNLTWLTIRGWW